ncbi:MAG: hypothetical protein R2854_19060 [Caldilineaceae bacterium]
MSGVVAEKTATRRDLYNRVGFGRRGDRDVERGHRARRPPHGRHPRRVRRRPSPLRGVGCRAPRHLHCGATAAALRSLLRRARRDHPRGDGCAAARRCGRLRRAANMSQQQGAALLGNQVPETIALAELATALGATGASAFGAGFGGSVWALVPQEAPTRFWPWRARYAEAFPQRAGDFFVTRAGTSAHRL